MTRALSRGRLARLILDRYGKRAEPLVGKFVIGKTRKGEGIFLGNRLSVDDIRAVYVEAHSLGLSTATVHVYGATCAIGALKSLDFIQIDTRTGEVYP